MFAGDEVVLSRMKTLEHLPAGHGWFPLGHLRQETRQGHILLCLALWSTISFLLMSRFVYSTVVVEGTSMLPTLRQGDRFVMNCFFHRIAPLRRGDLVVVRDASSGQKIIKRVIALPHETIQLRDEGVYINGRLLREPYVAKGSYTHSRRMGHRVLSIPASEYFVMGDNRLVSQDSRWHGPVRRADLLGTVER
jgi:signal peptidase I